MEGEGWGCSEVEGVKPRAPRLSGETADGREPKTGVEGGILGGSTFNGTCTVLILEPPLVEVQRPGAVLPLQSHWICYSLTGAR